MKIHFRNKITSIEADKLIEKYYEGHTTVEEEKKLHKFLTSKQVADKYKAEQAMFAYLKKPVQRKVFEVRTSYKWVAAVAALFVLSVTTHQYTTAQETCYAVVDGIKITDKNKVSKLAKASLNNVNNTSQQVEESLKAATNMNIIDDQLKAFQSIQ